MTEEEREEIIQEVIRRLGERAVEVLEALQKVMYAQSGEDRREPERDR